MGTVKLGVTPHIDLLIWIIGADLLGSLAYVLLAKELNSTREILGMLLFSTLSASGIGLLVFSWTSSHVPAILVALLASLVGPPSYFGIIRGKALSLLDKHVRDDEKKPD